MKIPIPIRWRSVLSVALGLCIAGFGASVASAQSTPKKSTTTQKKASTAKKKKVKSRRAKGQQAPTPDRISEIQTALAKDGSYTGEPTGKWDGNTVEAMRRFQAGHGMNPTGKLDAISLQRLGLGAKTAGVAPPYTPEAAAPTQGGSESSGNSGRRQ